MFIGRREASLKLLDILPFSDKNRDDWIIVSISFEGLFMAYEINKISGVKFQHLFIESIFTPKNNECRIAMISETKNVVIDEVLEQTFELDRDLILKETSQIFNTKITKKVQKYKNGKFINIKDKSKKILLLDDGIETGFRMVTAIRSLFNMGFKYISIATPVIPKSLVPHFKEQISGQLYFLKSIAHFTQTSDYYMQSKEFKDDFLQKIFNQLN
jgi:putative phosphoribosyl transferase